VNEQGDKLTHGPLKSRTGSINSTHFTDSFTCPSFWQLEIWLTLAHKIGQ